MRKHLYFILFALLFSTACLSGKTLVSGVILQNEWWSKDKSPYIVTNDIVIAANARLVIEPGVEILIEKPRTVPESIDQYNHVDSLTTSIRVLGALRCIGKPNEPIIFRSRYAKDQYGHWYGIVLNSKRSKEIFVAYTNITGATTALDIQQGMPFIRHSIFEKNSIGIRSQGRARPRIFNSIFTDNFLAALRIKGSNPYIYNNIVAFNRAIGVWGDQRSKIDFQYNLVFGNEERNYLECSPLFGIPSQVNKNGDSVDYRFNLNRAPLFAGSPWEKQEIMKQKKELKKETDIDSHKAQQLLKKANSYEPTHRFELSEISPCQDAGHPDKRFDEPNGTKADIGLWGGSELLEFK